MRSSDAPALRPGLPGAGSPDCWPRRSPQCPMPEPSKCRRGNGSSTRRSEPCRHGGESPMTTADHLPFVEAELNYLGSTTERPRYYAYDRDDNDPPPVMPLEPHRMQIHDLRPIGHELSLDVQGFALAEQRSAVHDFWDDDEVRRVYYPEAERFLL